MDVIGVWGWWVVLQTARRLGFRDRSQPCQRRSSFNY